MGKVRIVLGYVGVLIGISAFIAFCYLKNYASAILACLVGIVNGVATFLHILEHRRTLRNWYEADDLKQLCLFAYLMIISGTVCLIYYTVVEILTKKGINPISENYITCLVFSFILTKYSLTLLYYLRKYQNSEETPLIEENHSEAAIEENNIN